MSVCVSCGLETTGATELCHYHAPIGDGWAESNRIMCDFLHRKKIPMRLPSDDRDHDLWVPQADAA